MKLKEFSELLRTAVETGVGKTLSKTAVLPETMTKAEAYRLYGRSQVDRWITEGLLSTHQKRIDREKLEAIAASSNRITYLPVAER